MHKQWIGCGTQNFQAGRAGFKPEAVVIHRTGGSLADIDNRCGQAGTFSSAHYAVGAAGDVHQYVEESDTAFHAGVVVNPTWPVIHVGTNPNLYTIGIELEGSAGDAISGPQYDAAADLVAEIAARCQIAVDSGHIVLHDEIRAGRGCPGSGFDRDELLHRAQEAGARPAPTDVEQQVRVLRNSNVREGAPSTTARIVRVAPANSFQACSGFTDQGERVAGNSYWYRTQDGNYLWAGATDSPNPLPPSQPLPVPLAPSPVAPGPSAPPSSGIPRIDQLLAGTSAQPLTDSDTDRLAIGALQDLLTGLGFSGLPTVLSSTYGVYGPKTVAAVASFRQQQAIAEAPGVDGAMLKKMLAAPATDPRASMVYLSLVLGFAPSGMPKILSLVSQMEGAGKFAALNRNTDRAGLSFGLIQWAQKPLRLSEILAAMSQTDRDQFVATIGGGDAGVADALVAHCRQPSGGVDPKTGDTTNPSFELVAEPWVSRFRQAAVSARLQQAQVRAALAAFDKSYKGLQRFAPQLQSERSVGFMLDVANQFGDGGVAKLYAGAARPGMKEMDILEAVADASVQAMEDAFQTGVRARRDQFLNTKLLSDGPFTP
jgi:N-acetyl-anhydromuramyl-L-alanine amidase AmpD